MPSGLDGDPNPISSPTRHSVLEELSSITRQHTGERVMIGIDGASGSGKSTLADELASTLTEHGCHVVRASIDSFHHPRAHRHRLGIASPEGYYRDSHDLDALRAVLL